MVQGLARDGGLFIPERWPDFSGFRITRAVEGRAAFAREILMPFFEGDPLQRHLTKMTHESFTFYCPMRRVDKKTAILELFHGPTGAFKDFGARFLAAGFSRLRKPGEKKTILVATSGDTGSAVASAFDRLAGFRVFLFYPKGGVSRRQEHFLTCWPDHVVSFRVAGTFDDCQALVKTALADKKLQKTLGVTSANSINMGRLLPQIVYYARSSLEYLKTVGAEPGYIIPSGNLGNAFACFVAKKMGFPIREIVLATNANRALYEYYATGMLYDRSSMRTLANAMDVGRPSNLERLMTLIPSLEELRAISQVVVASDDQILKAIRFAWKTWGHPVCPHTATAVHAWQRVGTGAHWILVATAHPAKFDSIVEPEIGKKLKVPSYLRILLKRRCRITDLGPGYQEWLRHPAVLGA